MTSTSPLGASKALRIGFAYDSKADWLARGLSPDQCEEFQTDETIHNLASALRAMGPVEMIGGFKALTNRIATSAVDWDIIFNYCEGYGTRGREAQVPALLEAWGLNFTFSDSATLALCIDKAKTKMVLDHYRIPTAPFACVPARRLWPPSGLTAISAILAPQVDTPGRANLWRLSEKDGGSKWITSIGVRQTNKVYNLKDLERVLDDLSQQYPDQPILIERFLSGREFTVGIIGTGSDARVIGVGEIVFLKDNPAFPVDQTITYTNLDPAALDMDVYGQELKSSWSPNPQFLAMDLADPVGQDVATVALRAWRALDCRDGGRVDIRHDIKGLEAIPNFIEVNPIAGLSPGWSDLCRLAEGNGIGYNMLIAAIVESALKRNSSKENAVLPML